MVYTVILPVSFFYLCYYVLDSCLCSNNCSFVLDLCDAPLDQRMCLDPGYPEHDNQIFSSSSTSRSFLENEVIRFSCADGFRLKGPSKMVCVRLRDGTAGWQPDVKPICLPDVSVCSLPPMVEHGDYVCHPQPCDGYVHGTVVEFYCDPGYTLTDDYRYITCQYGQWFPHIQVYCVQTESSWLNSEETFMTWKVVSFTATGVLLVLLLLILIKVFQFRCNTFCQLRDQNPGHNCQNFLVVDGIPVLLPSYDEAVGCDNINAAGGVGSTLHPEDQGPPAYPGELSNLSERTNLMVAGSHTASTSPTVDIADDIPFVEDGVEDC